MLQDMEVSWMPSYGPEMRGGTANVTVILGDERISSPVLNEFDSAIILNQQSLDKFEPLVKKGGTLLFDDNGITRYPVRKDINIYYVDATKDALKLGMSKSFNMIVLGAFLKIKPVVGIDNIIKGLEKSLPARHHHTLPQNREALLHGQETVKKQE